MNLVFVILLWMIMGAILATGIVLAVIKGSFWLLIIGILAFALAVIKIGILSH